MTSYRILATINRTVIHYRHERAVLSELGDLGEARIRKHANVLTRKVPLTCLQILGCAIVVTVLLGCGKLIYTHWRLRKYAAVESEKKEQAIHRQMSQQRKCREPGDSDLVPFGIRALESGIEVDGVWVSPGNTPESASREHSVASSIWEHAPKVEGGLDTAKQNTHRVLDARIANSAETAPESFDRSIAGVPLSYSPRDRSTDQHIPKPARSRHPPLSYSRYQGNPYILRRQSSATSTLQGLEAIHNASTSIYDYRSGDSS